jgi:hypothetical protein
MINKGPILLLLFILTCFNLYGQYNGDSIPRETPNKRQTYLLPSILLISGILVNNSQFEKTINREIREKVGDNYSVPLDDYTQYAPIALLGLANIAGIRAKNHWFDQTKYFLISNAIVSAVTHGLKRTVNKTRPNGEAYSFPSGHTSFAFTNAMVLYKEYQYTSPILAYSGFAFSGTTATFRMLNNKHWLSDVLAGAGIAMLVTQLVYHFEPLKNFNPFMKQDKISIIPQAGRNQKIGLLLSIQL